MPKLINVLSAEISRLARKEIKKEIAAILEGIKKLKGQVSEQKKQIAALEKQLGKAAKPTPTAIPELTSAPDTSGKKSRISAGLIKKLRKRLGLSQGDFALLLGVSGPAVSSWEQGRAHPRGTKRDILVALRQLSPSDVRKRLAAIKGK